MVMLTIIPGCVTPPNDEGIMMAIIANKQITKLFILLNLF
jgi:hypothetical protein